MFSYEQIELTHFGKNTAEVIRRYIMSVYVIFDMPSVFLKHFFFLKSPDIPDSSCFPCCCPGTSLFFKEPCFLLSLLLENDVQKLRSQCLVDRCSGETLLLVSLSKKRLGDICMYTKPCIHAHTLYLLVISVCIYLYVYIIKDEFLLISVSNSVPQGSL